MDKHSILSKIVNGEEKIMLAKVLDKLILCQKQHERTFSDFLDPVRTAKFMEIINRERLDIKALAYGGAEACERKMLGFTPDYLQLAYADFPISALEITYNAKFSRELSHRDFLGSLMGLGIERTRVGDIMLGEHSAIVLLSEELSGYVAVNLERVGSAKVKVAHKDISDSDMKNEAAEEIRLTVASLRLDSIISAVLHIARSKSAGLIEGEKVFINWALITSGSKQVAEGDIITVRGLGRIQLMKIAGTTKKDRVVIYVKKFA